LNEYVWRWKRRESPKAMFQDLLGTAVAGTV
jgi:hypothetical protein